MSMLITNITVARQTLTVKHTGIDLTLRLPITSHKHTFVQLKHTNKQNEANARQIPDLVYTPQIVNVDTRHIKQTFRICNHQTSINIT